MPARMSFPARQRVDDGVVLEFVGERQPARVAGVGVEVGQHFVHAAELGGQHPLDLLVVELRQDALGPGGELDLHVERRAVAGVAVGVAQARRRVLC